MDSADKKNRQRVDPQKEDGEKGSFHREKTPCPNIVTKARGKTIGAEKKVIASERTRSRVWKKGVQEPFSGHGSSLLAGKEKKSIEKPGKPADSEIGGIAASWRQRKNLQKRLHLLE